MKSTSDKPLVLKFIAGCIAAILLFHFAWAKYYFINLHNPVFTIVDGVLLGIWVVEAIGAYRYADDPNKEWKRKLMQYVAAAACIWAALWSTILMSDMAQNLVK